MRAVRFLLTFILIASAGCTHFKHRRSTVNQAETLAKIYQQQVLDNLAMFVDNPHALPFFAYPKDGTNSVNDIGALSSEPFNAFRISAGGSFNRQILQQWGLTPVVEPDKLARMRCAYQRVVGCPDECCIRCCELEKAWKGLPDLKVKVWDPVNNLPVLNPDTGCAYGYLCFDGTPMFVDGWPTEMALSSCIDKDGYVIIPQYDCDDPCAIHGGWLEVGCLANMPRSCTRMMGRHGDTCVWVRPGGEDQLTRLTLEILDYAINNPPIVVAREKTVKFYIDESGNVVNKEQAKGEVQAVIGINDHVTSVITIDRSTPKALQEKALREAAEAEAQAKKIDLKLLQDAKKSARTDQEKSDLGMKIKQKEQELKNAQRKLDQLPPAPLVPPAPSPIIIPKQRTLRPSDFGVSTLGVQRNLRSISSSPQLTP